MKHLLLCLAPLLVTLPAYAASERAIRLGESNLLEEAPPRYLLDLSFAPLLTSQNDTSATPGAPGVNEALGRGVDLRATFGYAFDGAYLLGLTWNHYQLQTTRDVRPFGIDGVTQTAARDEWGPTIGMTSNGWRMLLTYFVGGGQRVATRNRNNGGTTGDLTLKNKDLEGWQASVSYTFRVTPRLEIGPTLSYRAVKYRAQARRNAFNPADSYGYVNLYSAQRTAALTPLLTALLHF